MQMMVQMMHPLMEMIGGIYDVIKCVRGRGGKSEQPTIHKATPYLYILKTKKQTNQKKNKKNNNFQTSLENITFFVVSVFLFFLVSCF